MVGRRCDRRGAVRGRRRRQPARASASPWRSPSPGAPGRADAGCPWPHTVGAWLLDEAGFAGTRVGVGPATSRDLLAALPGPVGVLAMGDGSARRTVKAPGYLDEAAGPFDAAVAARPAFRGRRRAGRARPGRGRAAAGGRGAHLAGGRCRVRGRESPRGCTTTTHRSASATSSPTGSWRERATGRRRRRAHRDRQDRARRRPRPPAGRRGGQRRLHAALPGHGHRHGQAGRGRARRGPAPPARPVARPRAGVRRRVPAAGAAEIDRLRGGGVVPLLVGGSGLYVRAVLDELDFPGTDPAVRARLEEELAAVGPAALHARLARLDPAAAAAVLPSNGRRIVRALEVIELTGALRRHAARAAAALPGGGHRAGPDPAELDERVAARVDRMWAAGLRRRGGGAGRGRAARGAHGVPRAGLRAGAGPARRHPHRRRGAGAHRRHHPPVRPPAALLVPPRPAHHLVRRRRGPTWPTPLPR